MTARKDNDEAPPNARALLESTSERISNLPPAQWHTGMEMIDGFVDEVLADPKITWGQLRQLCTYLLKLVVMIEHIWKEAPDARILIMRDSVYEFFEAHGEPIPSS